MLNRVLDFFTQIGETFRFNSETAKYKIELNV